MTHAELVALAAAWLQKERHDVVVTEVSWALEVPDALGFYGWSSTLVECKVSRADFAADRKKPFRLKPEEGMGEYRYFLVPSSLHVELGELPRGWGLLVADERGRVRRVLKAKPQARNTVMEVGLLGNVLRRVGQAIPDGSGVSVKFYRFPTKNTATLGVAREEQ